jgi:uncharacterized LabA/DUF88 family protein
MDSERKNIAYIDGQNLYMGTAKSEPNWHIDLARFRVYLEKKYNVGKAYYYLGYLIEENQDLYEKLQTAGFIVVFREHNSQMLGKKKGNVDSDIIFSIMKRVYKGEVFEKIVLVSGDGDYKMLVDFLIEEKRLAKILFPNSKFASSLYKSIGGEYFDSLENPSIKAKIQHK